MLLCLPPGQCSLAHARAPRSGARVHAGLHGGGGRQRHAWRAGRRADGQAGRPRLQHLDGEPHARGRPFDYLDVDLVEAGPGGAAGHAAGWSRPVLLREPRRRAARAAHARPALCQSASRPFWRRCAAVPQVWAAARALRQVPGAARGLPHAVHLQGPVGGWGLGGRRLPHHPTLSARAGSRGWDPYRAVGCRGAVLVAAVASRASARRSCRCRPPLPAATHCTLRASSIMPQTRSNGVEYVSTAEHKHYPFFATQACMQWRERVAVCSGGGEPTAQPKEQQGRPGPRRRSTPAARRPAPSRCAALRPAGPAILAPSA